MAKDMAYIENNIVITILWCSDSEPQTENLIDVFDCPVAIGDMYISGTFYRNGEPVLTPLEQAQKTIAEYESTLFKIQYIEEELNKSYNEGINSI